MIRGHLGEVALAGGGLNELAPHFYSILDFLLAAVTIFTVQSEYIRNSKQPSVLPKTASTRVDGGAL
jgi:hypothetical protein